MVNRVDGNSYHEYENRKITNSVQDSGEKFSLNYSQDNLQTEEKEKKTEEKGKTKTIKQGGVMLELSSEAGQGRQEKQAGIASKETEKSMQNSAAVSLRDFLTGIWQSIKSFLHRIWYDEEEPAIEEPFAKTLSEAEAEITETEIAEAEMQEAKILETEITKAEQLDRNIQPYLRTGDLPQVIKILTDDGKKSIAKNSTLLTYYDKNGKIVEPNASDRERILHGDRGSRKL